MKKQWHDGGTRLENAVFLLLGATVSFLDSPSWGEYLELIEVCYLDGGFTLLEEISTE